MTTSTAPPLDTSRYPRVAAYLDAYCSGPGAGTENEPHAAELAFSIGRARVSQEPFTVATVDGFLPDPLYQDVLRDWPQLTLNPVNVGGGSAKHVGSRHSAGLQSWKPETVDTPDTWGSLARLTRSAPLTRALFTRFADVVEDNLAHPDVRNITQPGFRLWANQDRGQAEALGAHVDSLPKLLTIVLYLDLRGPTTDESTRRWGTTTYAIAPDEVETVSFSPNTGRTPAGHIYFRPNRAFIMPNCSSALHGVTGGEAGVTRRSLMWGYWLITSKS
ncbi:hypothetical protein [Asanoa siamensis]|uniref:2-oxoglutarate-Fe(II)-dependent oxygenase superfamily protein n=1 Tax=Asanoa siamensis TaxID=926357 RepID=A0ABQ4CWJ2_9ACTN|nr:hypothetical protein [Asanoa siamensis]GIF75633.1 hypothetical protein Asi02nite_51510 [Asanoa siamensis]